MPSAVVLALVGAIGVYMFLYGILRITQDKREPPAICTAIPFLSPMLEMTNGGASFWNKMRDKSRYPIYTLRLPGSRLYVINSTALIQAAQRQETAISLWPVIIRAARNVMGRSSISNEVLTADMESPDHYFTTYAKYTHTALMPGLHLDAMSRTSVQLIAASLDRLQAKCSGGRPSVNMDLFGWIKTEMYLASTDAVYGPQNPIRDLAFQRAREKFESGIASLVIGIFPWLIAWEAILAREQITKAFKQYFSLGGHNDPGASELVRARFKHNSDYDIPPDDHARSELGQLFALLGNTLPTTFWLMFHMYSDPLVLADIRTEVWKGIVSTTRGEYRKYTLDLNHIKTNCPILLSTFKEVLRFRGIGVSSRFLTTDHLLDNRHLLKNGGIVLIPGSVQHSDPTIWGPTVAIFDHKRFVKHEKRTNPAAFRGFGGGSLLCPGRHFASTLVLAFAGLMAVRFDIRPKAEGGLWIAPTTKNAAKVTSIGKPDYDIKVKVKLSGEIEGVGHEWEIVFSGSDKPMEVSEDTIGIS